jgi:serine/threonine protein kinase
VSSFDDEDALFARAVVSFGIATEEQVRACLAELPALRARGKIKTLAQLLVLNGIVSPSAYKKLRQSIDEANAASAGITQSGKDDTLPVEAAPKAPTAGSPRALKPRRDHAVRVSLGVGDGPDQFEVGPYRVLGELGSGGSGMIYRAVDGAGETCALKLLLSQDSSRDLKRLIAEARIAMALQHPNIVRVRDVGVVNDVAFLAMDLVEGPNLRACLEASALSRPQAIEMLAAICGAVQYAHEKGVIHRDIKPANVMVRNDLTPLLADFGLAKDMNARFSSTGESIVGTPHYIAPEQLAGLGRVSDPRVDIWGLGVMLYEILAGKHPFAAKDIAAIYRKIRDADPEPPSAVAPDVSPEIEKVCLQALAKDPAERYQTAGAFGEDIRRFLRGEPVLAKRPRSVAELKGTGGVVATIVAFFRRRSS